MIFCELVFAIKDFAFKSKRLNSKGKLIKNQFFHEGKSNAKRYFPAQSLPSLRLKWLSVFFLLNHIKA